MGKMMQVSPRKPRRFHPSLQPSHDSPSSRVSRRPRSGWSNRLRWSERSSRAASSSKKRMDASLERDADSDDCYSDCDQEYDEEFLPERLERMRNAKEAEDYSYPPFHSDHPLRALGDMTDADVASCQATVSKEFPSAAIRILREERRAIIANGRRNIVDVENIQLLPIKYTIHYPNAGVKWVEDMVVFEVPLPLDRKAVGHLHDEAVLFLKPKEGDHLLMLHCSLRRDIPPTRGGIVMVIMEKKLMPFTRDTLFDGYLHEGILQMLPISPYFMSTLKVLEDLDAGIAPVHEPIHANVLRVLNDGFDESLADNDVDKGVPPFRCEDIKEALSFLDLVPTQLEAVENVIHRRVSMCQGPPGTGKTTALAAALYLILRENLGKVLVTTTSNHAANVIVKTLDSILKTANFKLKDGRILRVYARRTTCSKDVPTAYAMATEFSRRKKMKFQHTSMKRIIGDATIIIATANAVISPRFNNFSPAYVIIDEGGQVTPMQLTHAIRLGAESLSVFGDHAQLPPFAEGPDEIISMMKYLERQGVPSVLLDVQHRSNQAIGDLVSNCFYGGKVSASPHALKMKLEENEKFENADIFVVNVNTPEDSPSNNDTSKRNRGQSRVVRHLVGWISQHVQQYNRTVLVLTAYDGQLQNLLQALPQGIQSNVRVKTIDAAQGDEADIVIVVTTRSNAAYHCGFMNDSRRINVALSRARRQLCIVGDIRTLVCSAPWKRVLYYLLRVGAVFVDTSTGASNLTISPLQDPKGVMDHPFAFNVLIEGAPYMCKEGTVMAAVMAVDQQVRIHSIYRRFSVKDGAYLGRTHGSFFIRAWDDASKNRILAMRRINIVSGRNTRFMQVKSYIPYMSAVPAGTRQPITERIIVRGFFRESPVDEKKWQVRLLLAGLAIVRMRFIEIGGVAHAIVELTCPRDAHHAYQRSGFVISNQNGVRFLEVHHYCGMLPAMVPDA